MEDDKKLTLGFGALFPPISKQLKEQHFQFDVDKVKHFEKLRQSITYLYFEGLVSQKTKETIQRKIFDKVVKHVRLRNK